METVLFNINQIVRVRQQEDKTTVYFSDRSFVSFPNNSEGDQIVATILAALPTIIFKGSGITYSAL